MWYNEEQVVCAGGETKVKIWVFLFKSCFYLHTLYKDGHLDGSLSLPAGWLYIIPASFMLMDRTWTKLKGQSIKSTSKISHWYNLHSIVIGALGSSQFLMNTFWLFSIMFILLATTIIVDPVNIGVVRSERLGLQPWMFMNYLTWIDIHPIIIPSNHPTIQPSNHPTIQPSNHLTIQTCTDTQ